MSKKLLYIQYHDACCMNGKYDSVSKSHEQLLEEKATVATLYLVDEITGDEWGDDWNDAPSCCNSGTPYKDQCIGLKIVDVKLGEDILEAIDSSENQK